MDTYNMIASWAGWPSIVALLLVGMGFAAWVINERFLTLRERNEQLQTMLDEAKYYSPDVLLARLTSRHKMLSDELERLGKDEQANKQKISELEVERENVAKELGGVVEKLLNAVDTVKGYKCAFCTSSENYRIQVPIELAGEKITFDINTICFACGSRSTKVKVAPGQ